jgi:hypothetical protein
MKKKKTATIENKKKLKTSKMAKANVNSFKKNWLIQFSGVTTAEIDYILSRIGSKTGDIAPESGLVGAVVSMYFRQPEAGAPVNKNIKVRHCLS